MTIGEGTSEIQRLVIARELKKNTLIIKKSIFLHSEYSYIHQKIEPPYTIQEWLNIFSISETLWFLNPT